MPKYIETPAAPAPFSNYSQAVEVSAGARIIHVSGQVGVGPRGEIPEDERMQHELAWNNVLAILRSQNMSADNLVDCHVYITNPNSVALYREVRDQMLKGARPAATLLIVAGLASPRFLIEIAAVAAAP
ncbi:MAG TPA: RidA family protein [Aestuariivirgaceae bacterium]|jgi:enamine deaminase RidA (YjgF/YER057c/UK114 family)